MIDAIIDVGSNSVRLCIIADGIIILRDKNTTQLGENFSAEKILQPEPFCRTINAVTEFVKTAQNYGVNKKDIHIFATAVVREAVNREAFRIEIFNRTGVEIDIVSGEKEADIGLIGALNGKDGAILDIGGASSELAKRRGGKTVYSKSLKLGAVRLYDIFKDEKDFAESYIKEQIRDYGKVEIGELTLIGGTASACAFILSEQTFFDVNKNHGFKVCLKELTELTDKLYSMTLQERVKAYNIGEKRAKIIACGALLLQEIMSYLGVDCAVMSENDNILGYYKSIKGELL